MAATQAAVMTGGESYELMRTHPFDDGGNEPLILYMYVVVSQNTSTRVSTLTLGLYLKGPNKKAYTIGPWQEHGDSYLGSTANTFDGALSKFSGTWWIVSGKTITVNHNSAGEATAKIPWYWDVHSTWGGYYNANGTLEVKLPNIGKTYTACGKPSSLVITANNDNTVTLSCKIGSNGTNNTAQGVELFITCDGTTPTAGNYEYSYLISGTASTTVSKVISFAHISKSNMISLLGDADSCIGSIKFTARTIGNAGKTYYSATATAKSTTFTWHGENKPPIILAPASYSTEHGPLNDYEVRWLPAECGINNTINEYQVILINTTIDVIDYQDYVDPTKTSVIIPKSAFRGTEYQILIMTSSAYLKSFETYSGILKIIDITPFTNTAVQISEGNTIPATTLNKDKLFIDIGSGDAFKISWQTPTAKNNKISSYNLSIFWKDDENNASKAFKIFDQDIGNVNEFFVSHELLANLFQSYPTRKYFDLSVEVSANSIYGGNYNETSPATIKVFIAKGCSTYVKTQNNVQQTIWKRALAFAKVDPSEHADSNNTWALVQEAFSKDTNNEWTSFDAKYEVLTTSDGYVITDEYNEPIYVL